MCRYARKSKYLCLFARRVLFAFNVSLYNLRYVTHLVPPSPLSLFHSPSLSLTAAFYNFNFNES